MIVSEHDIQTYERDGTVLIPGAFTDWVDSLQRAIMDLQQITLFGTGDPKVMAGGISQALVTTVEGLVVAIPTTLLYAVIAAKSRGIMHVLEEQSAGLIAEHAERSGQPLG